MGASRTREVELLLASGFAAFPWPWPRMVYLFLCLRPTDCVVHGLGDHVCARSPLPISPSLTSFAFLVVPQHD